MPFPDSIDRKYILAALDRIDREGIPLNAQSTYYDLIRDGKTYPPKLAVSWAYQAATGTELDRDAFNGGVNTPCMRILANAGFAVERKQLLIELEEVDYFTSQDFDVLSKLAGEERDGADDSQNEDWAVLKDAYDKTQAWADTIQKNIFTGGAVAVRRDPTNQAGKFHSYNWARIYPCTNAKETKKLAYTVGIDIKSGFVIKIDTVSEDGEQRTKYESYRDKASPSQIVLSIPKEDGFALGWDGLVQKSIGFLRELATHYKALDSILGYGIFKDHQVFIEPFYDVLQKFLQQENDLTTAHYPAEHAGLKLKVSFGAGNFARIPWIAFLAEGQMVANGIYPVFLHYKALNCLVLAYGISETNPPEVVWPDSSLTTIRDYLQQHYDVRPERYGASYVYRVYDLNEDLDPDTVEQDLASLIQEYKQLMRPVPLDVTNNIQTETNSMQEPAKPSTWIPAVCERMAANGFQFGQADVTNFYLSLRTKPFVILAGISGTGKTQIVRQFASALGYGDERHCVLIPVRPDWADNTDLIGYRNIRGDFEEQPFLKVIQDAKKNPNEPFFVILDEMNLARVEHYFSDFLSVMETREKNSEGMIVTSAIVHDEKVNGGERVIIPQNLMVVGTVNMDETTHPFSRKVLDRANALEMNTIDLDWALRPEGLEQRTVEGVYADAFISPYLNANKDLESQQKERLNDTISLLKEINALLEPAGMHFGYRVRDEIAFYLTQHSELEFEAAGLMSEQDALDYQLMQKVLPRIQGSSLAVLNVLLMLLKRLSGATISADMEFEAVEQALIVNNAVNVFPRSTKKLLFMLRRFQEDGYTSFWL